MRGRRKSSWHVKGRLSEMHLSLPAVKYLNRIVQGKAAEGITTLLKVFKIPTVTKVGS